MKGILKKIWQRATLGYRLRHMPLRLEFVLTDYCNLNCKGCTHYSPLADKEFESIDSLAKSMSHLAGVCGRDVRKVYLIGGETLLYPNLTQAMRLARSCFKDQEIYIFTNGLALPRMDGAFWDTARECGIILAITRYPVKFDYEDAVRICRANGIKTEIFGDRSLEHSFFKFGLDPSGAQNPARAHRFCFNRGCVSIIGDRLYPCSISACVSHLNRKFGSAFGHADGDFLMVPQIKSATEIKRLRDNPVPFCRYCRKASTVSYGPSKRVISEWVE